MFCAVCVFQDKHERERERESLSVGKGVEINENGINIK